MIALIDGDRRKGKGANKYTAYTYITNTHKRCSLCEEIKLHSEFHKDSKNIYGKGLAYYCKECANKKSRDRHNTVIKSDSLYKEKKRDGWIRSKHGISLQQYKEKLAQQGFVCVICGVKLPTSGYTTHLDHDHKTGKLRDFLCTNCNRGLGHFKDNINYLQNAINYLNTHNSSVDAVKEDTHL